MSDKEGNDNGKLAISLDKPKHPMEQLLKLRSEFFHPAKLGEILEGTIIEKRGAKLFIDLASRGTGIVYGREYYEAQEIIRNLEPGNAITAKVVELDNDEGYIELSLKEAGREKSWRDLKEKMQQGEVFSIPVKEANRGGLILELFGVKGFLPVSQLAQHHYPRVENGDKELIYAELQKFIGQELKAKILDVNPYEDKLIFSERDERADEIRERLAKFQKGDVVEGEITGVVNFGAFMKFDEGLEGLIHISEIDWQLIEDPRAVLKVGDARKAKIIDIEGNKVSLSLKALTPDPWIEAGEKLKKNTVVQGKVTKFNPFGAFVQIDPPAGGPIQGLAHISEFGTEAKMKEQLELGRTYDFKVLSMDIKEHRLSLTLAIVSENQESQPSPQASADTAGSTNQESATSSESPSLVIPDS